MTQSTSGTPGESGSTLRLSRPMWQMPLLRGLALLALGVLLLVEPLTTLASLTVLFAVFLLVDAALAAAQGLVNTGQVGWRWWLVQSAVDVVFSIAVFLWPGPTPLVLFYLLLVWALVLGIVSIVGGVTLLRNRDLGWSWLLTTGIISTLFGLMLLTKVQSATSVLDLVVVVFGLYAFVMGAVHVVSVFSMRWVAQEIGSTDTALAAAPPKTIAGAPSDNPDRVSDDELAGLAFPDTPGMVAMPGPPPTFDEDDAASRDDAVSTDADKAGPDDTPK